MKLTLFIAATAVAISLSTSLAGSVTTTHTRLGISLDIEPLGSNHYSVFPGTFAHWTSVEFAGKGNTTAAEQVLEFKPITKSFPFSSVLSTAFEYALSEEEVFEDVMSSLGAMQSRGKMSTDEAKVALALYLAYVTEEGLRTSSDSIRHLSFVANELKPLLHDAMALVNRRRHRKGNPLLQYSTTSPEKAALMDMIAAKGGKVVSDTIFVHLGWTSTTVSLWKRVTVDDALELQSISFNGRQETMAAVAEDRQATGLSSVVDHLFQTIVHQQGFDEAKLTSCEKGNIWKAAELVFRTLGAGSSSEVGYVISKDCGTDGSLSSATRQSIGREELEMAFRPVFRAINDVLKDFSEAIGSNQRGTHLKFIAPFSLRSSVTASLQHAIAARFPSLSSDSFPTIVLKNLAIGASYHTASAIAMNKDILLSLSESGSWYDSLVSYATVDGFEGDEMSSTQVVIQRAIAECFDRATSSPLSYCKADLQSLPAVVIPMGPETAGDKHPDTDNDTDNDTDTGSNTNTDTDTGTGCIFPRGTTFQALVIITVFVGAILLILQRVASGIFVLKGHLERQMKETYELLNEIRKTVGSATVPKDRVEMRLLSKIDALAEGFTSVENRFGKKVADKVDEVNRVTPEWGRNTKGLVEATQAQLRRRMDSLGEQCHSMKSVLTADGRSTIPQLQAILAASEESNKRTEEVQEQLKNRVEKLGERCDVLTHHMEEVCTATVRLTTMLTMAMSEKPA